MIVLVASPNAPPISAPELAPLADAEVVAMAAACLGWRSSPPELGRLVVEAADGVPFLVEELLAALAAQGVIAQDVAGWRGRSVTGPVVPLSFADMVRARLEAFDATDRVVLEAAATLGRRFDWRLLAGATSLPEAVVTEALSRAVHAQLLVAEAGFCFRHALTREAVLDGLLPHRRAGLCHAALAAVEAQHPGLPGHWCELSAELAEGAGDDERAAALLLEAGRRALAAGSLSTAETTLDRARAHLTDASPLALVADEVLTEVLTLAGNVQRAFAVGTSLLGRLEASGTDPLHVAELHLLLARAAMAEGDWATAARHGARARALGERAGEPGVAARVDVLAAQAAIGQGHLEEAVAHASAARDLAEQQDMPDVACEALQILGRRARHGDLAEAERFFERSRSLAERHGLQVWRVRALQELATLDLFNRGGTTRLLQARATALSIGAVATATVIDLQLAIYKSGGMELEAAVESARCCAETSRRLHLATLPMALAYQIYALTLLGCSDETKPLLAELQVLAPNDPNVQATIIGRLEGYRWLLREDRARALAALERGMAYLQQGVDLVPSFAGFWALLRTLNDDGGAQARAQVAASSATIHLIVRACLHDASGSTVSGRC